MKYRVINSITLEDLTKQVNAEMAEGWQPSAGFWAGPRGFYQPMIKPAGAEKEASPKRAA